MESSASLRRMTLESLAIIASILLAFAIDAWWENSKERQRRIALLGDLKSEVLANIEFIELTIARLESYNQRSKTMVGALLGEVELTSKEFDELRTQLLGYPVFRPSWGILDLLTGSGDLLLLEDARLRAKLANLKPRVSVFVDNQELVLDRNVSDPSMYETGKLVLPYDLPETGSDEDPEITGLQIEQALKARQYSTFVYENLLKNQGKDVLEDLQEIAALLP